MSFSGKKHPRRCPVCYRRKSLRSGSFFAEFPRIPLGKILMCVFLWSRRELRTTVADYLRLTKNTVGNIYAVIRHYCGRDLQDRPVIPFGGRLYVVKCDESQFAHKSKNQRGRRARNEQWVFGIISTEHSPCRGYYQVVRSRNRAILTQIMQRVLLPGSEVHTDDWASYRNLPRYVPNVRIHRTVVHRDHFVDPRTGIHTQEAESAWSRLKYHVRREKGIRRADTQEFLNEQMWRDWRGLDNVFSNVIVMIRRYYPF